jgi:hypothetical protein
MTLRIASYALDPVEDGTRTLIVAEIDARALPSRRGRRASGGTESRRPRGDAGPEGREAEREPPRERKRSY